MKKYIKFLLVDRTPKTNKYNVVDMEDVVMGEIFWFWKWRQYVFDPKAGFVWSRGCLEQVQEFLQRMTLEQREGKHGSASVK